MLNVELSWITPNHYQVAMNMIWFSFSFLCHIPRFTSRLKGKRVQFKISFFSPSAQTCNLALYKEREKTKQICWSNFFAKMTLRYKFLRLGFVDDKNIHISSSLFASTQKWNHSVKYRKCNACLLHYDSARLSSAYYRMSGIFWIL